MSRQKLFMALICLASILSIGCSGTGTTASDAQITTEIQSKLYADAATKQSAVAVAVKDGAVTLSGEVANSDVELAAMKIANGTAGVHGVADQMKVNAAVTPVAPVAETTTPAAAGSSRISSDPAQIASQRSQPAPVSSPEHTERRQEPASSEPPATPPKPVEPARITIPAGDRLSVRTIDAIDSGKVTEGQALRASLESPLTSGGEVIIPAGAPITLEVTNVKSAGRVKGNSELALRATSLEYRGRNYPITTSVYADEGKARGKNTAIKTGVGAGLGALIGGLAGGGKGAAIGAGAGGGAGFGINALTHGQQIKIPSETVLNFRLEASLVVPSRR